MRELLPEKYRGFSRITDTHLIQTREQSWQGPFSWPGLDKHNNSNSIPNIPGVYLFTFEHKDGYTLRSVGVSSSIKRRLAQHSLKYYKGEYTVLDVKAAQAWVRRELWHGWKYAEEHQEQFLENKDLILGFVKDELAAYRVFITEVDDRRIRERVEAAILINAYSLKEPWTDIIDGGMHLRNRSGYEVPISMRNICPYKIHGLQETLEV